MAEILTFRIVEVGSDDYHRMVALRNKVLREPLGRRLTPEELARDTAYTQLAAFNPAGEVVATVLIDGKKHPEYHRARQVSVHPDLRGQDIGTRIMEKAHDIMREEGATRCMLHARDTAVRFYEKLGYVAEGDYFEDVGVPHILMYKQL